jgi:pimeloyl-ACP methyl ester carboxylesterase
VAFDLREPATGGGDLSVQEALAWAGIDTFAPSLLGYGGSTRFDKGLDDPGNASLRPYNPPNSTNCLHSEGCDRTLIPGINPLDQQGSMLLVHPLPGKRRAHTSKFRFARTDVWVRDIDQVIDDAIKRHATNYGAGPDGNKVALVGYSLGGQHVGRTLFRNNPNQQLLHADDGLNVDLHNRDKVIEKVSRVVFLNSLFGPPGSPEEPPGMDDRLTFPLTLNDRSGSDVIWRMPGEPLGCEATCYGHIIPGTQEQVWCQTMEQETLGRVWGGDDPNYPTGLNRAPTFSGYGWNPNVAGQLSTPTLVMQGLKDTVVPTAPGKTPGEHAQAIYDALPSSMTNKVLVQVECASHALLWEGCAGERCTPISGQTPYGGKPNEPWAGPHATLKAALIEWIKYGKFNERDRGSWIVGENGVARTVP